MAIIVIALAGWALLGPFIIGSGLKRRIEALERQVAALRAARQSPAAADTGAPLPIVPPVTRMPPINLPTPIDFEQLRRAPLSNASEMTLSSEEWAKSGRSGWAAVEEWLVQRWIIAAGGVTASLGGLFIVRYSIEQGLLGPLARIILGAVVGSALVAAAEFIRRRAPSPGEAAPVRAAQVPAAISAAGTVTLYGVTYAAYSFYHLIPGPAAFILLAVIAFGSLAAGLLYGPLAALLGTGMALLAPALIASDRPNAAVLFPYLLVVTAGSLALIRYRQWPWLVWVALAGNGLWQLSWALAIGGEQAPVRALHLLVLPMLCVYLLFRDPWPEPEGPWWRWDWSKAPLPVWTVGVTILGSFAFLWAMAAETGFGGIAASAWGTGLVLLLLLARWAPTQQPLLPIAAALTVGLVAAWAVPEMAAVGESDWLLHGPPLAPAVAAYVAPAAAYASIFGLGGFVMLWTSSRPALWASVSAATPLALLAVLYARLSGLAQSLPWAGVAMLVAALALFAAQRTARHRPRLEPCLAAYAAAVTAAIALAAAMALHAAWLTVALAAELPAMAWIWRRTGGVPGPRTLAGSIAAILAVRLLLNPYIPVYAGDMPILVNWLLYGYGIPAGACWLAARWFRTGAADDWVTTMLLAAALAFGTALMTLELWHMASNGGPLLAIGNPLRQSAFVGNGWLALGLILLRLDRSGDVPMRSWGWRLIGAGGLAWTVLIVLLADNPLWTPSPVGVTPFFNLILIAYGVPAILLLVAAIELNRQRRIVLGRLLTATSSLLLIATVLLEIRQAFHGARLDLRGVVQAETYSYSAGMLSISLGLLAAGLRWPKTDLRAAGFALLALTIGKTFIVDMDNLTGLWRAASFLGLGLCLIGIGYAYQKLARSASVSAVT